MSEQKDTRQIWIRPIEYSSAEVSGPSEVPWFVGKQFFKLVKEVKLICVRCAQYYNIVFARTSNILVFII